MQETQKVRLDFGTALQNSLKLAGINRKFLAESLHCSEDTIDNWCSGRSRIKPEHLSSLCSILSTKGKLNYEQLKNIYRKALATYGLSFMPTTTDIDSELQVTLCLSGSLSRVKELAAIEFISNYLNPLNQRVFVFHCGSNINRVLSCLDMVAELGISNIIMSGMTFPPALYKVILEEIKRFDVPVSLIATDCPKEMIYTYDKVISVFWSNYDLAYRATALLIESGYSSIATVHVPKLENRFKGYLQALKDHHIPFDSRLVFHMPPVEQSSLPMTIKEQDIARQLENFLLRPQINAIFTATELMTLMIPILLMKSGKIISEDISLCGVSLEKWMGTDLGLPLTYLSYPIREAAHRAIDVLMRLTVEGSLPPEERYIDVTSESKRLDINGGSVKLINNALSA